MEHLLSKMGATALVNIGALFLPKKVSTEKKNAVKYCSNKIKKTSVIFLIVNECHCNPIKVSGAPLNSTPDLSDTGKTPFCF